MDYGGVAAERVDDLKNLDSESFYRYIRSSELQGLSRAQVATIFNVSIRPFMNEVESMELVEQRQQSGNASVVGQGLSDYLVHFKPPHESLRMRFSMLVKDSNQGPQTSLSSLLCQVWAGRAMLAGKTLKPGSDYYRAYVEGMKEDFPKYAEAGITKIYAIAEHSRLMPLDDCVAYYQQVAARLEHEEDRHKG
ncbi:MAG: hypothetical protein JSS72_04480 [Armatimonadetes bacterium]|nr:hypothetical protein [Armatimonadota bacterium]